MLVTVTFDITTPDQKRVIFSDIYLYVDIEVTDEEYEKIGYSCDSGLYMGMFDDESLSDICNRCKEVADKWRFEEVYGEDILFRFDYPVETRFDRAELVWHAGYDEVAKGELIPTDAKLYKNSDGTYTVRSPFQNL